MGVGFRTWTKRNASELGLTGWVKNILNNGVYPEERKRRKVEAIFEGVRDNIEEMVKRCNRGPEVSWVEKVDVEWSEGTGELMNFEVRY